jgi:hypothetical protein
MNDVDMMSEESRKPCVLLCPMGEARTCGKMDDEQHAQPYHAQTSQSTPHPVIPPTPFRRRLIHPDAIYLTLSAQNATFARKWSV